MGLCLFNQINYVTKCTVKPAIALIQLLFNLPSDKVGDRSQYYRNILVQNNNRIDQRNTALMMLSCEAKVTALKGGYHQITHADD